MADRKSPGQASAAVGAATMLVAAGEAPWTDEELAEQRAVLGAELSRMVVQTPGSRYDGR